jgi:hypothetical protein
MHLASEKVRLAGEAAELAASFLVSAGSDYEAYEAEIEAKEGNRGGGARANPLQGVAFDGQAVALNPRTPNEVAIKEWAERVKCMRPGDHIAANTGSSPQEGNNGEEQWILAVYVDWNAEQDLFEVRDAEEDDPSVEQFKLRMREVSPLPKIKNGDDPSIHEPNTNVLAIYPETTVFYKARIVTSAQWLGNDEYSSYMVEFEGDTESSQSVDVRHVLVPPTWLLPTSLSERIDAR